MRGSASLPADPGEQFALVMNAVEDFALFLLDTEGKVIRWGRGAEKTLGFSEEEVLGQDFALIFTPEDRLAGVPGAEMATATREGRAADIRWHVRKDGSRLWCDGALSALRDEAGTLRGFVKVMQDATTRRELEDRLLAAYQRDHRIAETLQQSLLLAPSINSLRGVRVQPFYEAALDEALVGGDFYDAFPLDGGGLSSPWAMRPGREWMPRHAPPRSSRPCAPS
jgi:PAS domain S-box